ncbi:hypothetical protein Ptr902_06185 [Pyrenophora tritici-repentis]|uniref:Uncharacterized protein n=1 Tax=Pyrenophora tritici-repentis TaxID=45151 RepID=A0A5M9LM86_9PLEO|nr:hypothetical protein PtrV1_00718 [Pyrenophora tritici-repentis]KAF7576507.1 hypothetical protein PtrM4_007470 [Pyrenophora tritici-repentis]KAI0573885.1 hypothetical protein Alg215_08929 [Pyrenophora tritici-repentis]KAI0589826.1 hypothetical protein Alg130_02794 [Pyrenophora tritici-repentis]KAI0613495.1 hypothetical protein TUN205_02204 [Pyrenophora tritici-repentis]
MTITLSSLGIMTHSNSKGCMALAFWNRYFPGTRQSQWDRECKSKS